MPPIQDLSFLKTAVRYYPLVNVSGDIYDMCFNREGDVNFFLGDVTGHGIAAALITMMVHIAFDTANFYLPVDEIVTEMNGILASRSGENGVCTFIVQEFYINV